MTRRQESTGRIHVMVSVVAAHESFKMPFSADYAFHYIASGIEADRRMNENGEMLEYISAKS